jgi:hypothetical protein
MHSFSKLDRFAGSNKIVNGHKMVQLIVKSEQCSRAGIEPVTFFLFIFSHSSDELQRLPKNK